MSAYRFLAIGSYDAAMDLRQLAALVAVDDHGSFSAAARALYTVQSNVSAHIAHLERELGVTLVDRARGRLTPEGDRRRGPGPADPARAGGTDRRCPLDGRRGGGRGAPSGVIGTTARWLVPQLLDGGPRRPPQGAGGHPRGQHHVAGPPARRGADSTWPWSTCRSTILRSTRHRLFDGGAGAARHRATARWPTADRGVLRRARRPPARAAPARHRAAPRPRRRGPPRRGDAAAAGRDRRRPAHGVARLRGLRLDHRADHRGAGLAQGRLLPHPRSPTWRPARSGWPDGAGPC